MKLAIWTDFTAHQHAYSLCQVVLNQVRMIRGAGYSLKVFVRPGFNQEELYMGAEVIELDPGELFENIVKITSNTGAEIEHLTNQAREALRDVSVVLSHDLIYQPNCFKGHLAARRIAKERKDLHWYHWVHSATAFGIKGQMGKFAGELEGSFPNATLVAMHEEEMMRKGEMHGYPPHKMVRIPNPVCFQEDYHPVALETIATAGLWDADIVIVYPCRLDRGKQPHILIDICAALRGIGWDAKLIIIDFHSTGGDKKVYREEMVKRAEEKGADVFFTSTLTYPGAHYEIPHKAVMDLLDFGDFLIHPSVSESDPLILPEAAWKRCGLDLNFDLPLFRLYQGRAMMHKFSSVVDVTTGLLGETTTKHTDYDAYMRHCAAGIAYHMTTNPVLALHVQMRQQRSLKAVWERNLWPAIQRHGPLEMGAVGQEQHTLASIIIPCYLLPDKDNELLGFTTRCIDSIRKHLDNFELVLVDNGSPKQDAIDYLKANADIYIRNEENLGFAPAVNQGLAAATGDWLIVCNNDIEFVHDWITKAVRAWHDDTGIISSHLLAHDPQMRVGREVPEGPERQVGYFMGALWMVHRSIYDEVGGLDEAYLIGMFEDRDLVQSIIHTGKQMVKIGHVKHIGNATWGKMPNQNEIYLKNKEYYEKKWLNK